MGIGVCRDAAKMDIPFVLQSFGVIALGLKKCSKVSRDLKGSPAESFADQLSTFTADANVVLERDSKTLKGVLRKQTNFVRRFFV